jgi:hypothetical protein
VAESDEQNRHLEELIQRSAALRRHSEVLTAHVERLKAEVERIKALTAAYRRALREDLGGGE